MIIAEAIMLLSVATAGPAERGPEPRLPASGPVRAAAQAAPVAAADDSVAITVFSNISGAARNWDGIPDWIALALRQTAQVSSFVQEPTPARGRSTPRLLLGIGLAAFGAYWAVHERRCRGIGSLSRSAPGVVDRSVGASPDSQASVGEESLSPNPAADFDAGTSLALNI